MVCVYPNKYFLAEVQGNAVYVICIELNAFSAYSDVFA